MLTLEWVLPGFFVDFFLFSLFPGIKQISDPFLNKKRCLTLLREWSVEDQSNLDFHWVVDMFLYKKVCYPCGSQFSLQGCPGKQLKCIHSLANLKEVKQFQKPTCKYKQIRVKLGKYSCIASCFFILFLISHFFKSFPTSGTWLRFQCCHSSPSWLPVWSPWFWATLPRYFTDEP